MVRGHHEQFRLVDVTHPRGVIARTRTSTEARQGLLNAGNGVQLDCNCWEDRHTVSEARSVTPAMSSKIARTRSSAPASVPITIRAATSKQSLPRQRGGGAILGRDRRQRDRRETAYAERAEALEVPED